MNLFIKTYKRLQIMRVGGISLNTSFCTSQSASVDRDAYQGYTCVFFYVRFRRGRFLQRRYHEVRCSEIFPVIHSCFILRLRIFS